MLEYDEKRDYIRRNVNCEVTYKMADSVDIKTGRCTSLSGAGVSFITERSYDAGLAMEIKVLLKNSVTPSMTAFIEVVRSISQEDGSFEVAASIKSLK
ncbi:MAG: PilZ domain-containing protein [Methylococcales symbiont of Hymedesmia sp. n. MRB-2018]|nr:MAG: PilZ domain-containing protein [Methylococcales symbiont of Hymedesmia sp. n. MRB-2018]